MKKFILVILLLCNGAYAHTIPSSIKMELCKYEYIIDVDDEIHVCSNEKISDENLHYLWRQFYTAMDYYIGFLNGRVQSIHTRKNPTIYIVSIDYLNNSKIFENTEPGRTVVARYSRFNCEIYLSPRVFHHYDGGRTDFAHEVVHYLNDNIPIVGPEDEKMAQQFEPFYADKMDNEGEDQTPLSKIIVSKR